MALLRSVAVAPGLHKQGIGRLLVQALLQQARARDIGSLHLLTVTAPEYFAQYGFKRDQLDKAPAALKASAELQGACPACAAFMSLTLREAPQAEDGLPVAVLGAGPVGLAAVAKLLERGLPFVACDLDPGPGASWVMIDDRGGARMAAEHLAALGHRYFAILSLELAEDGRIGPVDAARRSETEYSGTRERLDGYEEALTAAGIDFAAVPVIESPNDRAGSRAGAALLLDSAPDATAILCMSDVGALAVIAEARKRAALRSEGRAYVMQDGDVVEFLFNVSKK